MRIGQVAERAGMGPRTIRYYEAIGLLPPPRRTPNGYRDYDGSVLECIAFVRAARSVGLSLGEIREVLAFRDRGEAPCDHLLALMEAHAEDLDERIRALASMRAELRELTRRARELPRRPAVYCHIIEWVGRSRSGARLGPASGLSRRARGAGGRGPGAVRGPGATPRDRGRRR